MAARAGAGPGEGGGIGPSGHVHHLALPLAQHVHHRPHMLLRHLNDSLLKRLMLVPVHLLGDNLHASHTTLVQMMTVAVAMYVPAAWPACCSAPWITASRTSQLTKPPLLRTYSMGTCWHTHRPHSMDARHDHSVQACVCARPRRRYNACRLVLVSPVAVATVPEPKPLKLSQCMGHMVGHMEWCRMAQQKLCIFLQVAETSIDMPTAKELSWT